MRSGAEGARSNHGELRAEAPAAYQAAHTERRRSILVSSGVRRRRALQVVGAQSLELELLRNED